MTEETLEIHQNASTNFTSEKDRHGIGIPGLDRLRVQNYNRMAKAMWRLVFLLCLIGVCFQCWQSISEYLYGMPAVTVTVEKINKIQFPEIAICPIAMTELYVETLILRKKYKNYFNLSKDEVQNLVLSDYLRLPDVNMNMLWNLFEFFKKNVTLVTNLCISFNDGTIECQPDLTAAIKSTTRGTCITTKSENLKGASILQKDDRMPWIQLKIKNTIGSYRSGLRNLNAKAFGISPPRELTYTEPEFGIPLLPELHYSGVPFLLEIIRLDAPGRPCLDDRKKDCISLCIQKILYDNAECRLPFMAKDSLPDCETPELFNKTTELIWNILRERRICEEKCPPLCQQIDMILFPDITQILTQDFQLTIRFLNPTKIVIKEEYWYTFNNLVADIGSSLGVFLGVNVLTLFEIFEVLQNIAVRKWTDRRRMSLRDLHPKNYTLGPNAHDNHLTVRIGITGFDRIFNPKSSRRIRLLWINCILFCSVYCVSKIRTVINDFKYIRSDMKLIPEFNSSINFPSFTICPVKPFQTWEYFEMLKEEYRRETNFTKEIDDITISDLMNLPDNYLLDFWNKTYLKKELIRSVNTRALSDYINKNFKVVYDSSISLNGQCLTMKFESEVTYSGVGTFVIIHMNCPSEESLPLPKFQTFIHAPEDDIKTLNLRLGVPFTSFSTMLSITFKKIERLNRFERPCAESAIVAKCRTECIQNIMQEITECRLPFMENKSYELCDTPDSFNRSMENIASFYDKYPEKWCNCPLKCTEYIYEVFQESSSGIPIGFLYIIIQAPSNLILVSKEYKQLNVYSTLAQIFGYLSLFLGFNILTIVDLIEALFILSKRIKRYFNKK